MDPFPQRIVCLTEEPTEVLYSLGEERRIVGISAFTVRPARARREKKVVSGFTNANVAAIVALEPDLVVGFSDIQAEIAKELVGRGVEVWIANHRSVEGILAYVRRLGAIVGAMERAERLARELEEHVASVRASAAKLPRRPRVYFEEWDEPRISAIRWVSELIEVAGGVDVFAARSRGRLAKERLVAAGDGELRDEVVHAAPDVMLASWCGKPFRAESVVARPGWSAIPAVRDGELHEIDASAILQPGPAALTDGLDAIHARIVAWAQRAERR